MKKEKKNIKKKIRTAIIVCSIIIIILLLLLINIKSKEEVSPEQVAQEQREETVTNYVRDKGEKERMQIYLAEYIKLVERKEYELAYEKLYSKFKENYFPTIEIYKLYLERNYSDLMMINYNDIQRQGNYYILSVTITNLGELESEKSQKFIIYENGLNDYYLSFQAE